MTTQNAGPNFELSRRRLLAAAGLAGGAALAASIIGTGTADGASVRQPLPDLPAPPVAGLHLQLGADASSEMVVSWHTLQSVRNAAHSHGFAAFTVDPGLHPGYFTAIEVTYYDVVGTDGVLAPFESFTLRRPRRD